MKRFGIALAILVASLVIAAQVFVERLPLTRVRPILERDLGEILGLDVQIKGPMKARLIPWLHLDVEDVVVENLPNRPSPSLLEIEKLALEIRLIPLLSHEFVFEALQLEGIQLRIEPDADENWALAADLDELDEAADQTDSDAVQISIRALEVRDLEVFIDPHGRGPVRTLHFDEMIVSARHRDDAIQIETRGSFEGGRFDAVGTLGSPAELARPTRPFPVQIEASVIEGRIDLEGTFEDPRSLHGANLRLESLLVDPAARARELGFEVPPLGSLDVEGRLIEREGKLGLDDLHVRSRGDGPIEVDVSGRIGDLRHLHDIDLALLLAAADADLFQEWTTLSLPGMPVRADLRLRDKDGTLGIAGEAALVQPGGFEVRAHGGIDDLLDFRALDVQIDVESDDVRILADALGRHHALELPPLGPVVGSGRLVVHGEALGLEEIDANVGDQEVVRAEVHGSVADLRAAEGVDLDFVVSSPSVKRIAERFDRPIQEIGGLEASFSISDEDGSIGLENATLEVGHADGLHLSLAGGVEALQELGGIEFETRLKIPDLHNLSALARMEFVSMKPIDYAARVEGSIDALRSRGSLQIGATRFTGTFDRIAPPGKRPKIDFRVHSPTVDITDLLTPLAPGAAKPILRPRRAFDLADWWRGDDELPLDSLRAFDAELHLEANHMTGYELLDLDEIALSARLENGRLVVDDLVAEYESGRISGRLDLDTSRSIPRLDVELEAFNVDLTMLASQFREETDYAGLVDLSLDLETTGARSQEVRSNLQGSFGAMLRDGALVGEYSRAVTLNLLRVAIPDLRFGNRSDNELQCFLALFPVENGVAQIRTLYLEGSGVTIQGTGQVDFARNAYDLQLRPQLHEPGLVGVAARVKVSGPLDSPEFTPQRGSLVTSALDSLWRNSLRPITAITRITTIDRLIGMQNAAGEAPGPCDYVLHQRVEQMKTGDVETIDLEKIAQDRVDSAVRATNPR